MNRRIRNRTYGGVEAGPGRLGLAIRSFPYEGNPVVDMSQSDVL